jgi:WD40 repeat protein/class 3 adenylate cyclase
MVERTESSSAASPSEPAGAAVHEGAPEFRAFLIADIRGWTNFTRERGAAAAGRLAKAFADLARDAVEARGGIVFELRGDEAVAVFNEPAQAVRAAVELQATLGEATAEDPTLPLLVGIGVDAGDVVPVEDGFRGSPLNMAARLCSNAAAGQVLVSQTVETAARGTDELVFEDRGTTTLKGFDGPTPFFEVVALPPGPAIFGPIDAGHRFEALGPATEIPLVGREHEMRWARGTWQQIRRGYGRVVCVSGPSQIGKTRLAAEIASYVEGSEGSVRSAGAGGTALADGLVAVDAAAGADGPTLVILDDVDAAGPELAERVTDALDSIANRPAMVLLLAQHPNGSSPLGALVERIDVRGDGHRPLSPLDQTGVREIGRTYLGDDVELAPLEAFFRSSGGVPGRVHEVVSGWAREEATRRLSAAAEWLVAGRTRRANDLEFANNVLGLKLDQLFRVSDAATVEVVGVCPYKGLATFREEDAALFFGRERLVGELAARSVDVGLLGVIGASGSGKSSVIAAGLRPSLAAGLLPGSERWEQISLRPGEHPMAELRAALGTRASLGDVGDPVADALRRLAEGARLVLVVDQFEEAFTACTDDDERNAFIDVITRSALADPDRLVVVVILRADFYGHCAGYPALAALLGENHVLLGPMSKDELRRAIELPARRTGLRVESGLTERLVEDVDDEAGGLPLLSTALVELWQRREDGWLRAEMHEQTGGVRGAVARLAESSYAHLSDSEQAAARRVFHRLVVVGDDEVISRRRVALEEFDLDEDQTGAAVIGRLTQDRLLTVGGETVEVSHEALLREWPRLRGWLEEDREGRRLHMRLVQAANAWDESGRTDDELLRGATLASAMDWSAEHSPELNQLERTFLGSSRRASELEAERQRRTNRRLRALLIGVAAFLAIALVAGSLAVAQRSRARAASRAATAQRLGAQALQQDDLDLKLLLARQGVALYDSPVTERNAALLSSPAAIKVVHPLPGLLGPAVLSRDGSLFAVGNFRMQGVVVDTLTYENVATLPGQPWAFSSDGERVLVNTPGSGTLAIVDLKTGRREDLDRALVNQTAESISTDFKQLATVDGATITFWDTAKLAPSGELHAPKGQIFYDVNYTADGRHLETVQPSADFTGPWRVVLRDAVTHDVEETVTISAKQAADLSTYALSRDGKWLALGFGDGKVSVVNIASGHEGVMSRRHDGAVESLVISPDDATLASGGDDTTIKIWDLSSGELRETLTGHVHSVSSLAISPDGTKLYSVSLDGSMIVWDLQGSLRLGKLFVAGSGSFPSEGSYPPVANLLAVSPSGGLMAAPQCDGSVVIRDVTTLQKVSSLSAVRPVTPCTSDTDRFRAPYDAAFTPDGQGVVVGGPNGQVTTFDARSGEPTGPTFSGPKKTIDDPVRDRISDGVEAVAVSPDGKTVAAGTDEGRVYLWDEVTGKQIRPPITVPDVELGYTSTARNWVFDLAFSPDGSQLAASHGSAASVWATSDWTLRYSVDVDDGAGAAYAVCFSPDGRMLATAGGITDLRLWDAASGAQIASIPVDTTYTISLSWSPDSSTIATGGWDGSIKLVDVASRSVVGALPGPTLMFNTVAFTPDGSAVLVVYEDGRGIRWTFDPAAWAQRACEVAGRTLTQDEWNRFLPGLPYDPAC